VEQKQENERNSQWIALFRRLQTDFPSRIEPGGRILHNSVTLALPGDGKNRKNEIRGHRWASQVSESVGIPDNHDCVTVTVTVTVTLTVTVTALRTS
jgi:hypothetical protein